MHKPREAPAGTSDIPPLCNLLSPHTMATERSHLNAAAKGLTLNLWLTEASIYHHLLTLPCIVLSAAELLGPCCQKKGEKFPFCSKRKREAGSLEGDSLLSSNSPGHSDLALK